MSRAIIIGTGMAGKLTAKVISPYVDEVIMIERNKLDVGKEVRKGIPQGNHFHALLSRGYQIINNLFPKTDELMKLHNGNKIDMGQDFTWYHCGIWKKKHHMDIETYVSSRPLLDWILLQQVKEIKNVKILDNTRVVNLIYNKIYNQVIGVKITKEGNLIPTELTANIVIDTSGRSTKTEKWFEDLGIGVPKSKEVKVDLKYASRYFEMPDELKNKLDYTLIYPKPPYSSNIGFIYPMEGKIGITLSSMFSEIDISTEEGFKDHIMNLDHPLLSEIFPELIPISNIRTFSISGSEWKMYHKLKNFPKGFLVMGDAFVRVNPIYGQGMTSAAIQAETLAKALRRTTKLEEIHKKYYKMVPSKVGLIWKLSTAEDLRYSPVEGKRSLYIKIFHWYSKMILETSYDPQIYKQFMKVFNFIAPEISLFKPTFVIRLMYMKLFGEPNNNYNLDEEITILKKHKILRDMQIIENNGIQPKEEEKIISVL